jgi:hypothetical protein
MLIDPPKRQPDLQHVENISKRRRLAYQQPLTDAGHWIACDERATTPPREWDWQAGWPLHFIDPRAPLKPTTSHDIVKVLEYLGDNAQLTFQCTEESETTISITVCGGDHSATLSLYHPNHGKSKGNVRQKCIDKVRQVLLWAAQRARKCIVKVRQVLLCSAWFKDAGGVEPYRSVEILPNISDRPAYAIEHAMSQLCSGMGPVGRRQLAEFAERSGVEPDGQTFGG